jgi:hypothetical protein
LVRIRILPIDAQRLLVETYEHSNELLSGLGRPVVPIFHIRLDCAAKRLERAIARGGQKVGGRDEVFENEMRGNLIHGIDARVDHAQPAAPLEEIQIVAHPIIQS